MRRYFGVIWIGLIVLAVLLALSAAGNVEFDRPRESELNPIRSSYSTGPTGTRAFYQFLEESDRPVSRWRENYRALNEKAQGALLVIVGPFPSEKMLSSEEASSLKGWIAAGGNALIISRYPIAQFGDPVIHSQISAKSPPWYSSPEELTDSKSDELIVQPTALTKGLKGLALSKLASRMKFYQPELDKSGTAGTPQANGELPTVTVTPETSPTPSPSISTIEDEDEDEETLELYAPVIHMGDKDGAILADFDYGDGRVVFLSDPFVIATNGIARGSNLDLALNLIDSLSEGENDTARRIIFDEYHHGYRDGKSLLALYFSGTPVPWMLGQGMLLGLLILYTFAKRFARPVPLTRVDRHSPLEFVSSMANLQRVAQARDLAIENIYHRFKAHLCRRLGLSSRASIEQIVASTRRQRLPVSEMEIRQALISGEMALKGEPLDDSHLVKLVARMRRILAQISK